MNKKYFFLILFLMYSSIFLYAQNMSIELISDKLDINLIPEEKETVILNAIVLKINSPYEWILTARIENALLSEEGEIIPISNMYLRKGLDDFKQLSYEPVIIATGIPTQKSGQEIILDFLIKQQETLSSGNYHTKIIFDLIKIN